MRTPRFPAVRYIDLVLTLTQKEIKVRYKSNLLGYFWLATVGTGIAYSLWFRGIDKLPVGQVSLLGLLSPIVATAAGWLVLDQRLTATQLVGAAILLATGLNRCLPSRWPPSRSVAPVTDFYSMKQAELLTI